MDRRQLPAQTGSTDTSLAWTRPSDWIAITDPTGTQKFVGVYAVYEDSPNFVALTCAGNYTVDWGDGGATENVSSDVKASHEIAWADVSSGTLTSGGYRQALITVTPNGGNLTSINLRVAHAQSGLQAGYSTGWLDVAVCGTNLTSLDIGGSTIYHRQLERVQIIGTTGLTTYANLFASCSALRYVNPDLDWSSVTSAADMFNAAYALTVAPAFNWSTATSLTTVSQMFINCRSLVAVPTYTLPSNVTTVTSMFEACYSLTDVTLSAPGATACSRVFYQCTALVDASRVALWAATSIQNVFAYSSKLAILPTRGGVTNFDAATTVTTAFTGTGITEANISLLGATGSVSALLQSCAALTKVTLTLGASGSGSMASTFNACPALVSVTVASSGWVPTSLSGAFSSDRRLVSVTFGPSVASVTTFADCFYGCYVLRDFPAFTTTAATSLSGMFRDCYLLTDAPTLDLAGVTDVSNMFSNCASLRSLPAYAMSTVTTATTWLQGCYSLVRSEVTGMAATHDYSGCQLSATALDEIYTNLASGVTAKTITVTGNYGTSGDTPATATGKGWTVTG